MKQRILRLYNGLFNHGATTTQPKRINSFKTAETSLYVKYKDLYLSDIAEFEQMETVSALHEELNCRIVDALKGEVLLLDALKLLGNIS